MQILILEHDPDRVAAFTRAVSLLGRDYVPRFWSDPRSMMAQAQEFFPESALISLGSGPAPAVAAGEGSGTGLELAEFLGDFLPVCPVLLHTAQAERARSMYHELGRAGWTVEAIRPEGLGWIGGGWLERAPEIRTASHSSAAFFSTDLSESRLSAEIPYMRGIDPRDLTKDPHMWLFTSRT